MNWLGRTLRWLLLPASFLIAEPAPAVYPHDDAEFVATAFFLLLASSDAVIPESSGCYGEYGQAGMPRVKDLLAMELAYLHDGKRVVEDSCKANRCTVTLNNAAGEGASGTSFEFEIVGGKLDIRTLECGMLL